MRSILAGAETVGTKILAGTPSRCAAWATATPWLPPEAATTPASGSSRSSRLAKVPRVLNDPEHCSCSSLRQTVCAGCAVPVRSPRSTSPCLLYTSDAADDLLCVDLGGR